MPSFAPNSMGFGHGRFGHTAFGHGPWVTFPHTPGFVYTQRVRYAPAIATFTDRGEQRVKGPVFEDRLLTYSFDHPGSALAAAVASWFVGANGPATRFLALNHAEYVVQSGGAKAYVTYVVRFADTAFETDVADGGLAHALAPITFRVSDRLPTPLGQIGWGGEGTVGWGEEGWGG